MGLLKRLGILNKEGIKGETKISYFVLKQS